MSETEFETEYIWDGINSSLISISMLKLTTCWLSSHGNRDRIDYRPIIPSPNSVSKLKIYSSVSNIKSPSPKSSLFETKTFPSLFSVSILNFFGSVNKYPTKINILLLNGLSAYTQKYMHNMIRLWNTTLENSGGAINFIEPG